MAALTRARRSAMRADLLARCWDADGLPEEEVEELPLSWLVRVLALPGRLLVGAAAAAPTPAPATSSILEAAMAEVVKAAVVAATTSAVRNFIVCGSSLPISAIASAGFLQPNKI